jgi:hypothetical protein
MSQKTDSKAISETLHAQLAADFADYGLALERFFVTAMTEKTTDDILKKSLQKLSDTIRYSDPRQQSATRRYGKQYRTRNRSARP